MKILQIANGDFFSSYGGGQVYVKNLVDEMISQQMNISIISFVNVISEIKFKKNIYKETALYELYKTDSAVIRDIIYEIKPDVIHVHAQKALIVGIAKELNIPVVVTAHHGGITCPAGTLLNTKDEICTIKVNHKDCLACVLRNSRGGLCFYSLFKYFPLQYRIKLGRLMRRLPFIYFLTPWFTSSLQIENKLKEWQIIKDNVDLVIAPSLAIANNMKLNGLSNNKVKILPHGIPFLQSAITGSDVIENPNLSKLKFFYLGRICYVKGIHNLLEAFIQLDSAKCELHLIGDLSGKYEQQLQKKYYKENIFFHGKIDYSKVLEYISKFDVLVHPAIYLEVFGLNISEALSQGKPVIATRCGGAEMQIEDGVNGLLINPNDIEELKDAMRWMIQNPVKVREMKVDICENVVSIEKHVSELMELYQNIRTER